MTRCPRCNTPSDTEMVEYLSGATTTAQLEARCRELFRATSILNKRAQWRLRQAIASAGRELVSKSPYTRYVPMRLDKGKGCSRRYRLNDKIFYTGTWGNGPGFRWAMADLRKAFDSELRCLGFRSKLMRRTLIDWALYGYPHRALEIVEQRFARCKSGGRPSAPCE